VRDQALARTSYVCIGAEASTFNAVLISRCLVRFRCRHNRTCVFDKKKGVSSGNFHIIKMHKTGTVGHSQIGTKRVIHSSHYSEDEAKTLLDKVKNRPSEKLEFKNHKIVSTKELSDHQMHY